MSSVLLINKKNKKETVVLQPKISLPKLSVVQKRLRDSDFNTLRGLKDILEYAQEVRELCKPISILTTIWNALYDGSKEPVEAKEDTMIGSKMIRNYVIGLEMRNVVENMLPVLIDHRLLNHELLNSEDVDYFHACKTAMKNISDENDAIYNEIGEAAGLEYSISEPLNETINEEILCWKEMLENNKADMETNIAYLSITKDILENKVDSMKNEICNGMTKCFRESYKRKSEKYGKVLARYPGALQMISFLIKENIPEEKIENVFKADDVRYYFPDAGHYKYKEIKETMTRINKTGKKLGNKKEKYSGIIHGLYEIAKKEIDLHKAEDNAKIYAQTYLTEPLNKNDTYFASKYRALDRINDLITRVENEIKLTEVHIKQLNRYVERNSRISPTLII